MKRKFHAFFTLLILLAFSLETVATVVVFADADTYAPDCQIEKENDNLGMSSWISEANEETSDDKVHGIATLTTEVRLNACLSPVSKIKPNFQHSFGVSRHRQILRLICRLSI